jgi:hypothetical protein
MSRGAALPLEIARRNARLRAYRALGVPVEGEWRPPPPGGSLASIQMGCTSCGYSTLKLAQFDLERTERNAISLPIPGGRRARCEHLAPLLGEDSPEVRAIYELELLAGD